MQTSPSTEVERLKQEKEQTEAELKALPHEDTATTSTAAHPSVGTAGQPWSPELVQVLGFGFLGFAIIVLLLMTWSMRQVRSHSAILRAFGLLLIITAAVFLVVVGYGEQQIAPVLGLLGTIAGYLLGKDSRDPPAEPTQREQ